MHPEDLRWERIGSVPPVTGFEKLVLTAASENLGATKHHGCAIAHAELVKNPANVGGYGPFADLEPEGDLLVGATARNQAGDLQLTRGQEVRGVAAVSCQLIGHQNDKAATVQLNHAHTAVCPEQAVRIVDDRKTPLIQAELRHRERLLRRFLRHAVTALFYAACSDLPRR